MYKNMLNNIRNAVLMILAKAYCLSWSIIRCRLLRRIEDLEYLVSYYPKELNNNNFFEKKVIVDDAYCKTTIIKVAEIMIEYSIIKFVKAGEDVFEPAEDEVVAQISKRASRELNTADVIQLKNWKAKNKCQQMTKY